MTEPSQGARAAGDLAELLLATKFAVPQPRSNGAVSRADLIQRARSSGCPVVGVTAPAGYGKSTLLGEWSRLEDRRVAWVSLDRFDDDPAALLVLLASAYSRFDPGRAFLGAVAAEWGTGQVFWSMMWFFLWFIWLWMLIVVFGDIFRSRDLSGWAKALWSIFVIIVPYLGVFVYLIARGHKMGEHAARAAQAQDAAFRQYVQETAGTSSPADELAKLADLRANGVIDDAEFQRLKAQGLG